jgi:hypothetical protein
MNVLFEIEGREAIPVRALAWMTQWHFSADMVVEALETSTYTKKERSFPWASKLRAYRNDGREIQEIEPRYWKNSVVPRIEELLEQKLPRETWEREATKAIPAGYFVWRDEWEPAYNGSPDGPDVLDESDDEDDKDDILDRSERTLNFSPAMPDDIEVLVREGFPQLAQQVVEQSADAGLAVVTPVNDGQRRVPMSVFLAQESELLHAIQEAGYEAKALPIRKPRVRGVKAEIRAKLKDHRLFVGEKKFNKAWDRLRGAKEIGDSSSPALE